MALDVFLEPGWVHRRHLADQRQAVFFRLYVLFFEQQTNAADVPGMISMTPFGQGLQMFFGRVGRLEINFWAISARVGGGMPVSFMFALMSSEYFSLARVKGFIAWAPVFFTAHWRYIRCWGQGKAQLAFVATRRNICPSPL